MEQYKPHDFAFRGHSPRSPFDAELTGEFTGPDNLNLRIPGFYDGDGTWKIRFSAPVAGEWRLRTVWPVAAFNGKADTIQVTPNRNTQMHGVLEVDREHPYHSAIATARAFF